MTEPLASEVWPVVLPSQKVHLPRIIFFLQIDVEKELRGRAAVAAEQTDRLEIRNCGEMRKQTNSSQRDFNRHNEFNFVWCMQAVLKSWMSTFQTFVIPSCKVYIFQSKHSRAISEIIQSSSETGLWWRTAVWLKSWWRNVSNIQWMFIFLWKTSPSEKMINGINSSVSMLFYLSDSTAARLAKILLPGWATSTYSHICDTQRQTKTHKET